MDLAETISNFSTTSDLTYRFFPGNGPLLVFIHGVLDRGRSFYRMKSRLKDRAILVYDRRGYGESINLEIPYRSSIEESISDLNSLLSELPAILIGHSYGAVIALGGAISLDNILGCVIYEPPLSWLPWWTTLNGASAGIAVDTDPHDAVDIFMSNSLGKDRWSRLNPNIKDELYSQGETLIAELTNLRQKAPFDPDRILLPMVLSYGSESTQRQKRGIEYLSEHILNSRQVEILGAKHNAHMTHYKDFANMIESSINYILGWHDEND